ncbi:LLM class flavin-dependent oxidoreductase [Georgenia sp. AZ-5]|uniref:LLM class flavin-dependent oxidoreductase n=1 Tax=Georgenia sp. AZ-5 TaxID=3367526 RepID=UPI003754E6C1
MDRNWHLGVSVTSIFLDSPGGSLLPAMAQAGRAEVDYLSIADHVSFRGGVGVDGLLNAAALLSVQDRLPVTVGVFLLALRHPVLAARHLVDLDRIAPGRLTLAVGVGGEDRHELEVCGVDPARRGRRTDEALEVLRPLLAGEEVTHRGEHFAFDAARLLPAVSRPPQILVGGRSEAALRRVARLGDGWQAMWTSPRRFATATAELAELAAAAGRTTNFRHGLTVFVAVDPDARRARSQLETFIGQRYGMPLEKVERWCAAGTATDVAEFLHGYLEVGCTSFTIVAATDDVPDALQQAEHVREALLDHTGKGI